MKTPQAILIGLTLIAAALWLRPGSAPAQADAHGVLPGFQLVADTQVARAWRLNTETGAIGACAMRGDTPVCSPWIE